MGFLDNPYQKNPYGTTNTSLLDTSKPVFGSSPNVATFGNTEVITTKPIVTQSPYALPTGNFKLEKSQAQKDFESRMKLQSRLKQDEALKNQTEKASWWKMRTKTQKALIVSGGALVVLLTGYFIYKSTKNGGK
jgi:hypothetical protein